MAYFDHNATTPLHPVAKVALRELEEKYWHNPSSPYRAAAMAHAMVEEARLRMVALLGGGFAPEELIFTSGATEANNAVMAHFAQTGLAGGETVISSLEHPSVVEAAQRWFPGKVKFLPCDENGVAVLDGLGKLLNNGEVKVVSLLAANNETGVIQPWAGAAAICREAGVPFHCDATQWVGKMDPAGLAACDYLTGSAHKFGGPKGVGFLKIAPGMAFEGQRGGAQEHDHRAGTENLPGIGAMVAALMAVGENLKSIQAAWKTGRDALEKDVKAALPGVSLVGENASRLGNTSLMILPRHENTRWVALLDRLGYEVSTGSACATGREGPSHVLAAMGIGPEEARRAIRLSAGWETRPAAWLELVSVLAVAQKRLDESP